MLMKRVATQSEVIRVIVWSTVYVMRSRTAVAAAAAGWS